MGYELNCVFVWYETQISLEESRKTEVQNRIQGYIENYSEFDEQYKPCHPDSGPVEIHLSVEVDVEGPFLVLAGYVRCKYCGNKYLVVEGKENRIRSFDIKCYPPEK